MGPGSAVKPSGPDGNAMVLNEYLIIYGTARITEGGGAELLQKLAHTYLGADVRFPPMDKPAARVHYSHPGGPDLRCGPVDGSALTRPHTRPAAHIPQSRAVSPVVVRQAQMRS